MPLYYPPDRLLTSNEKVVLTSTAGTSVTFSPSTSAVKWNDNASNTIMTFNGSASGAAIGLNSLWHSFYGRGNASPALTAPDSAQVFGVAEDLSRTISYYGTIPTRGLYCVPGFDTDVGPYGTAFNSAEYNTLFITGFDSTDGAGGSQPFTFKGQMVTFGGSLGGGALVGSGHTVRLFDCAMDLGTPAASGAWTELTGVNVGGTSNFLRITGGTAPTRSYGIKVGTSGNGTTSWAGMFAGDVQISGTNKLRLGKTGTTTQGTNYLYSKTATGTTIVLGVNSADTLEFATGAVYPTTNGGLTLGQNNNGFASLLLKDTAAAFETTIQCTGTSIAADNTLTIDVGNASRTLKLTGNITGDQDVSTTGTPQFARLGVGAAADGTVLLSVNDSVTAPSTTSAGSVTNRYGGATNFCGDPNAWLRVKVGASTYKIPLYT